MTTALQSVQKLIDHIESVELAKRRNNNASIEPSAEDKSERDRLMNAILQSLGLTRDELLSKLGADRTSWDRWRYLASKPHRSYLDAMKRFAAETDREEIVDETLPKPLVMLASRPCNWAKLRLVFSLYNCWRNAIFKFSEPYSDIDVIIEMALLSLRGCKIVFIIPEEKINVWGCTFIAGLKSKLNKVVAARVLSRICVIKSNVSTNNDAQLGMLNYDEGDADARIGYLYNTEKDRYDIDMYAVLSWTDDYLLDLRRDYAGLINSAFSRIKSRENTDFWTENLTPDRLEELLKLPLVDVNNLSDALYIEHIS